MGCFLRDLKASFPGDAIPAICHLGIAGLLWVVIFRFLCKLSGIPWVAGFQERPVALRRLSFNQYVCLLGALSWGFAMCISSIVYNHLQGTLTNTAPHKSAVSIAFELVLWLAGGCLFGWMAWGANGPTVR